MLGLGLQYKTTYSLTMIKIILFSLLSNALALAGDLKAQTPNTVGDTNAPVITLEKDTVDFGTLIRSGTEAWEKRFLKFKNTGKSPLFISSVPTGDGGTMASASFNRIEPGDSGRITVYVNKGHAILGWTRIILKMGTINSNANPPGKVFYIKAKIVPDTTQHVSH